MLFVTNRTPKQSNRSRWNRRITFDLQDTGASQHLYFCERRGKDDYVEIGRKTFFHRLKNLSEDTQVLLYIHGFNNTGEAEIFPNTEKLQRLLGKEADVLVVPMIWPCDDDSGAALLGDYWDDQLAASASGYAFARLLGMFDSWRREEAQKKEPCTRRINILAHSMGNRVLCSTINIWASHFGGGQMPLLFRNVFMFAADVPNDVLGPGKEGQHIPDCARNVTIYFANDDLAMPASKVSNLKHGETSRRMGMTGPSNLDALPENVRVVDCDDFNNKCDCPLGHTYFLGASNGRPSPALVHMGEAIRTGRVSPNQRRVVLRDGRA